MILRAAAPFLVVLLTACTADLPAPNTPFGLYVRASVSPTEVSLRDTDAVLDIRVTVENPSDQAIVHLTGGPPFTITPDPLNSSGLDESYRIAHSDSLLDAGPSADWWGAVADSFPAHHGIYADQMVTMKSWRAAGFGVDTGTYTVRAYFNGREGMAATFRLVP